jgi:hypothetical protein
MDKDIFYRLREQLDGYAFGYPSTESGVEIELLKLMFTVVTKCACRLGMSLFGLDCGKPLLPSDDTPGMFKRLADCRGIKEIADTDLITFGFKRA